MHTQNMTGEVDDLSSLTYEEPITDFTEDEMNKLDGTRIKVESVKLREYDSNFAIEDSTINGKVYKSGEALPKDVTVKAQEIVVTTVPPLVDKELRVSERFPLKKRKKDGKWVASLHEKSKTYKALKKYSVNRLEELNGKDVILSKKVVGKGVRLGINLG